MATVQLNFTVKAIVKNQPDGSCSLLLQDTSDQPLIQTIHAALIRENNLFAYNPTALASATTKAMQQVGVGAACALSGELHAPTFIQPHPHYLQAGHSLIFDLFLSEAVAQNIKQHAPYELNVQVTI